MARVCDCRGNVEDRCDRSLGHQSEIDVKAGEVPPIDETMSRAEWLVASEVPVTS